MTYWYLASPYSKYAAGMEAAFTEAARETGRLMRAKVPVFSPITHTHPIAIASGMDPLDHTIWMPVDQPMMDAAVGLIVLMMDGWRESYGVTLEIIEFTMADKPIVYMEPGTVPASVLP